MKTVLITGAAGFIGSSLADALIARGDSVVGVDCFNDYYDPAVKLANLGEALGNPHFQLHEIDICNREAVLALWRDVRPDVVVHLASTPVARRALRTLCSPPALPYTAAARRCPFEKTTP
jgi:UDP-glucuronate 4-epimerase